MFHTPVRKVESTRKPSKGSGCLTCWGVYSSHRHTVSKRRFGYFQVWSSRELLTHSSLTRSLEWRSEEVSTFFFLFSFFFYTIWTLAIEKVCPTSKDGSLLTEGLVLQVQEAVMMFLSHCSGPFNCSSFHFSMNRNSGVSIHF